MNQNIEFQDSGRILLKDLYKIYTDNNNKLQKLREEYSKYPDGDLYIRTKSGKNFFYEKKNSGEKAIGHDKERIDLLMKKRLIEHDINCRTLFDSNTKALINKMESGLKKYRNQNSSLTLKRIYSSEIYAHWDPDDAIAKWKSENYKTNPHYADQKKLITNCDLKVRSKSEKIIADKLWNENITFRYEAQLSINGFTCYPDFTIRKKSGKIVIWEHFGLLEDNEYFQSMIAKLEKYRSFGFRQHTNLICTYEDDIISCPRKY